AAEVCDHLEGEAKNKCLKKIAARCYESDQYGKAAHYYIRAGAHIDVVDSYLVGETPKEAEDYCNSLQGKDLQRCASKLARYFYIVGNYKNALRYYGTAGDTEKVREMEAKTPLFQMKETIEKDIKKAKEKGVKSVMAGVKKTITICIYNVDNFRNRQFHKQKESGKKAAVIRASLLEKIDGKTPVFVQKVRDILDAPQWTVENTTDISIVSRRLSGFIRLLELVDRIAGRRTFFDKFPTVAGGSSSSDGESDFDKTLLLALTHCEGYSQLLQQAHKEPDAKIREDLLYNADVDLKIVEYLSGLLDNVKTRVLDIKRLTNHIRKKGTPAMKTESESLLREFTVQCNLVLKSVLSKKYDEANQTLLTAYEAAKEPLTKFKKSLKRKAPPAK
ncbi:MAG: hypothetical protein GY765_25660, partial [bacterium]|nr:hypothetical protein [bacterium]